MAVSKKSKPQTEETEAYARLVATIPEVELKGDANPYTSLNGNMFSFLHKSVSMALRLPPQAREPFLAKYGTKLFDGVGPVQPEYVAVPADLLLKTEELQPYFAMSYEYAKTLKPKPSKKNG